MVNTISNLEANKIVNELNSLYNKMNNTSQEEHFKFIINDNKQYLFIDYNLLWSSDNSLPMRVIASSIKRQIIMTLDELNIQY